MNANAAVIHAARQPFVEFEEIESNEQNRMTLELGFLHEVERALEKGTVDRRRELLQRITDLFVVGAVHYTEAEVAQFDHVIARLAVDIELSARALLAARLAPIPNAPPNVIRTLAFDDDIGVAGSVLALSGRLDDPTLVQNALEKSQEHLLAISRRQSVSEMVTDVLLKRGDQQIVLSTAKNLGAKFSSAGFEKLIERSAGDNELAECVGSRPEIPPHLFLKLLAIASDTVRAKLEAEHPHSKHEVRRAVDEVSNRIRAEEFAQTPDYGATQAALEKLFQSGSLDDDKLRTLATNGRFEETTVALALMCDLPLPFVERCMIQKHSETVLILAKMIGLSWSTVQAILLLRSGKHIVPASELAQSLAQFDRLKRATAIEIVRFYRMRNQNSKSTTAGMSAGT